MKDIYLLYSCDAWSSFSSMNLQIATTDQEILKNKIMKELDMFNMEMDEKNYRNFILNNPLHKINTLLQYGHIQVVGDGEEQ